MVKVASNFRLEPSTRKESSSAHTTATTGGRRKQINLRAQNEMIEEPPRSLKLKEQSRLYPSLPLMIPLTDLNTREGDSWSQLSLRASSRNSIRAVRAAQQAKLGEKRKAPGRVAGNDMRPAKKGRRDEIANG